MSLDLERFVVKLQHDYPTDFSNATVAEEAIAEYQRMLVLVQKIPNQPVVPSRLVDLVWHSHILDTQQYARDTLRMFGKYMHHSPSFGGKEEKQELVEQQKKMFASYKREFGEEAKKQCGTQSLKKCQMGSVPKLVVLSRTAVLLSASSQFAKAVLDATMCLAATWTVKMPQAIRLFSQ